MTSTRAGRALALASLLLGGAGCEGGRLLPPRVPTFRLADLAAAVRGSSEPEMTTIGDVSRYLLGARDHVSLDVAEAILKPDAAGRVAVSVECADAPQGPSDGIVVTLAWLLPGVGLRLEQGRQWVPETCDGRETVRVEFDDLPPKAVVRASAELFRVPPARVAAPRVTLPQGAELRVAVGLRAVGVPSAESLAVMIRAEDPNGRTQPVSLRRLGRADVAADGGWIEWRVSLDPIRARLGPEVSFAFEAERVADEGGALHVLWGDPTIFTRRSAPPPPDRQNVLLVSLDTLRADHVGHLGYPEALTPTLDRLATEGVTFTNAVSQANWTLPAHASMLTGTYPCTHRLGARPPSQRLPAGVSPLAEQLRRAGYATGAFTENGYVMASAFQRGFDVFLADSRVTSSGPSGVIEDTVAAATAFMEENRARRFFAFVHSYQVHEPYEPPEAFRALATRDPLPTPTGSLPPSAEARGDAGKYAAEVAYTDQVVGRLLRRLEELGLSGETIVIVTSDHGEAFGEHGKTGHGNGFHREQIRVPLTIRLPGRVPAGRRVERLAGIVDVSPTVLSLLDLPVPAWMQGVDLSAALDPDGAGLPARRVLPIIGLTGQAYRGSKWLISGRHFHDLARDPLEQRLRAAKRAELSHARRAVEARCRRSAAILKRAGQGAPPARALPAAQAEKLRALGYVD